MAITSSECEAGTYTLVEVAEQVRRVVTPHTDSYCRCRCCCCWPSGWERDWHAATDRDQRCSQRHRSRTWYEPQRKRPARLSQGQDSDPAGTSTDDDALWHTHTDICVWSIQIMLSVSTAGTPKYVPNSSPFPWRVRSPTSTWFFWPTRVHNPNINLAIFAGLTNMSNKKAEAPTTLHQ